VVLCDILEVIKQIHEKNLFHGNIKASNVLLSSNFRITLMDKKIVNLKKQQETDMFVYVFIITIYNSEYIYPELIDFSDDSSRIVEKTSSNKPLTQKKKSNKFEYSPDKDLNKNEDMCLNPNKKGDMCAVGVLAYLLTHQEYPFYNVNPFMMFDKILKKDGLEFTHKYSKELIDIIRKLLSKVILFFILFCFLFFFLFFVLLSLIFIIIIIIIIIVINFIKDYDSVTSVLSDKYFSSDKKERNLLTTLCDPLNNSQPEDSIFSFISPSSVFLSPFSTTFSSPSFPINLINDKNIRLNDSSLLPSLFSFLGEPDGYQWQALDGREKEKETRPSGGDGGGGDKNNNNGGGGDGSGGDESDYSDDSDDDDDNNNDNDSNNINSGDVLDEDKDDYKFAVYIDGGGSLNYQNLLKLVNKCGVVRLYIYIIMILIYF
jgi:serine/threonine protein kinase